MVKEIYRIKLIQKKVEKNTLRKRIHTEREYTL